MKKVLIALCLFNISVSPATFRRWVIFPYEAQYRSDIILLADAYGIDRAVFMGLIAHESMGFQKYATSPSGARGLTQLMPSTAWFACPDLFTEGDIAGLYDTQKNLRCGARYLSWQLHDFRGCLRCALSAYNAGPGATRRAGGRYPTLQASLYVPAVLRYATIYRGTL